MNQFDTLYQVIWQSRPLMQAAEAVVERGLRDHGLTVRMRAVLEILTRHGPAPVPEIAHHLEIQRQYVQLMVNDTHAAGLTGAAPNPRHQRSKLITLTQSGQRLIDQVMQREAALLRELAGDLGGDDIATTLRVMRALTDRLKQTEQEDTR